MIWNLISASHILVKNKLLADKIILEIENYDDFKELAKEYSYCYTGKNGGYIGYFVPGDMVEEIDIGINEQISNNCLNKLLTPIKSIFGYHIFYIHTIKKK